jgi:putative heme iron utilization protein
MTDSAQSFTSTEAGPHQLVEGTKAAEVMRRIEPLEPVEPARSPSAAEHARTILAGDSVATLATLSEDGSPWASVVQYSVTGDGTPVLILSTLAAHGRNVKIDARVSLALAGPVPEGHDPGDSGRVSLAGVVEVPEGDELEAAKQSYFTQTPAAELYTEFGDFTVYVMRVKTIRWVGGFGRMASTTPAEYAAAEVDPTAKVADYAVRHMNEDHADALLEIALAFTGHTDATSAMALRADRYGMDIGIETPRGKTNGRVEFAEPVSAADGLRSAVVELTKAARASQKAEEAPVSECC